jgi:anti-sigma-K factor RskA
MNSNDNIDPRIEALLPFYVLDALDEEEEQLVESYLAQHPEARAQVQELRAGASALPYSVAPVEPSRRVKEALMARINSEARRSSPVSNSRQPAPPTSRFEGIFRLLSLGAAVLAILWAFLLNAQVARLRNEITVLKDRLAAQSESLQQIIASLPQTNQSDVITVSLKGTEAQPQVQGQLIADPNGQSAVLVIAGLPPLEAGRTYQVWLIDGGTPVSAGLLTVDENGQAVFIVSSESEIGSFNSLGISIEPEGGSMQPTGDIVVLSDL